MPFYYDFEEIEWPEDEDEAEDYWPEPAPEEYEYLKPEDLGGGVEPVQFLESNDAGKRSPGQPRPQGSLVERLLWRMLGGGKVDDMLRHTHEQNAKMKQRQQQLFQIAVPVLKEIGAVSIRCAYDGGNDEGFAWFQSVKTADGTWTKDETIFHLVKAGLVEKLRSAELLYESPEHPRSDRDQIESTLEDLASEWGMLLLGGSFGTGAYQMYGAFEVDLIAGTIIDDPQATPAPEGNISFPSEPKEGAD